MVKLTKAERRRRKAEKRARLLREQEERKIEIKKDKLNWEINYANQCMRFVKESVDRLATKLRWPLIRAKLRHAWGYFELTIDWKNQLVQLLLDDFEESQLRMDINKQIHFEIVDRIIQIHEHNVKKMLGDFIKRRNKMMKARYGFLRYVEQKGLQLTDYISAVGQLVYDEYQRSFDELNKDENENRLARLNEEHAKKTAQVVNDMHKLILSSWADFHNTFRNHMHRTKTIKQEIVAFRMKDIRDNNVIVTLFKRMDCMKKEIEKLKKSTGIEIYFQCKIDDMGAEKSKFIKCYNVQRRALRKSMADDNARFSLLGTASNNTLKGLEEHKKKVEVVLRFKGLCRKMETEEEKIIEHHQQYLPPFPFDIRFNCIATVDKFMYQLTNLRMQNDYMEMAYNKLLKENKNLREKVRYVLSELQPTRDIDEMMGKISVLKLS